MLPSSNHGWRKRMSQNVWHPWPKKSVRNPAEQNQVNSLHKKAVTFQILDVLTDLFIFIWYFLLDNSSLFTRTSVNCILLICEYHFLHAYKTWNRSNYYLKNYVGKPILWQLTLKCSDEKYTFRFSSFIITVLIQIFQVSNKQQQKKSKYTAYLSKESAEVSQVQYTPQQIISRRKSSTVHVSAESKLRQAKYSSRRNSEYSEDCRLKYMIQQRISRLKRSRVHVSAENQHRKPSAVHVSAEYQHRKARSHATGIMPQQKQEIY
jgi:hypothetical protein